MATIICAEYEGLLERLETLTKEECERLTKHQRACPRHSVTSWSSFELQLKRINEQYLRIGTPTVSCAEYESLLERLETLTKDDFQRLTDHEGACPMHRLSTAEFVMAMAPGTLTNLEGDQSPSEQVCLAVLACADEPLSGDQLHNLVEGVLLRVGEISKSQFEDTVDLLIDSGLVRVDTEDSVVTRYVLCDSRLGSFLRDEYLDPVLVKKARHLKNGLVLFKSPPPLPGEEWIARMRVFALYAVNRLTDWPRSWRKRTPS